jgi:hypothetical protein
MRRSGRTLLKSNVSVKSSLISMIEKWQLTSSYAFHDLLPRLQALTPVVLPLEQIARMECVSPQLKHASQLSRRGGRPEAELLHEAGALRFDKFLELAVEFCEFGVV